MSSRTIRHGLLLSTLGVALCAAPSVSSASDDGLSYRSTMSGALAMVTPRNPEAPHGIAPGVRASRQWARTESRRALVAPHPDSVERVALLVPGLARVSAHDLANAIKTFLDTDDAVWPEALAEAERTALTTFYTERDFAPVWTIGGRLSPQAQDVVALFKVAAFDGLDPQDYLIFDAMVGLAGSASQDELLAAELAMSGAVMRYARHAQNGRISPSAVSSFVDINLPEVDRATVLEAVAVSANPQAVLGAFHPTHAGYLALRDELEARLLSAEETEEPVLVDGGKVLRQGETDDRVAQMRVRLGLAETLADASTSYDSELATAVKAFQRDNGLTVDGIVGPQTISVLNGAQGASITDLIVNMERWRWLPRDLGDHHVFVNIPEYHLDVVSGGAIVFETRVIVGTIKTQTPVFSDEMEHLVVNPSWNVPVSIAKRSILPAVQNDPTYVSRRNFQVYMRAGGRYHAVDAESIDWTNVSAGDVRFRQRPGGGNALGDIKFMFPNRHAVYLHDTNSRGLFRRTTRALSNGCVRVENPIEFSDALLKLEDRWSASSVQSLIRQGREAHMNLDSHIPVHLAYFTVSADEAGELRRHDDVYGHDRRMKLLLRLD